MLKLFSINNNICDQILNEVQVHFTKACPNKCIFCIDALNKGITMNKPDVNQIFITLCSIKHKIDDITISGGEPFLYIDELYDLCKLIKTYLPQRLCVITSLPETCYKNKSKFLEIIDMVDMVVISPQHMNDEIGDKIRRSKTTFDRKELLQSIPCKDKVSLTLNLIKGYLDTVDDVITNIKYFESLGFRHFKISEMFNRDSLYVSFEKLFNVKMKAPFSHGCSTKKFDMSKWIQSDSDFTIKRSCFYKCNKCHAHFTDLLKILIRPFFAKKYFFGVIYEKGELLRGWV